MQSKFLYFQVVEAEHLSHETKNKKRKERKRERNKAVYMAALVADG